METLDKVGCYPFLAEPFHCDFSGRLFLGHLGNHMLNAADFHSTDRGFGMRSLLTVNRSCEDGTIYGYGRSIWAMIDTETRQPTDILSINDGSINNWIEKEKTCPIDKGGRVRVSDDAEFVRTIETNYNDVDINGHINSVKYIEHVLDLWPLEWYKEHTIRRFEIAYVAEAHAGDTLSFYREKIAAEVENGAAEDEYCIRIVRTDGTECCRSKVIFR